MKSFKVIIVTGELWNADQTAIIQRVLRLGIEKVKHVDTAVGEIIDDALRSEFSVKFETDNYDFEALINPKREEFLQSLKSDAYESFIIIYAGMITNPFGQWVLRDGIVRGCDVVQSTNDRKLIVCSPSPCEEWHSTEKKANERLIMCPYDLVLGDDDDGVKAPLLEGLGAHLVVEPALLRPIARDTISTIRVTGSPTLSVFLDRGCSVAPCLVSLEGCTVLINGGYGPRPQASMQMAYHQQVDVGLLTQVAYSNITSWSRGGTDLQPLSVNHLFLPIGTPLSVGPEDADASSVKCRLLLDLRRELTRTISHLKATNADICHLGFKNKTGIPAQASALKPVLIYHKIGYGTLEMVVLSPFEDDVDIKKYAEDWKKGKYPSHSPGMSLLLVWRPQSTRLPVRRMLYLGSAPSARKLLPVVVPALHTAYDHLRLPEFCAADAHKKPTTAGAAGKRPTTTVSQKPAAAAATSKTPVNGSTTGEPHVPAKTRSAAPSTTTTARTRPATATKTKEPISARSTGPSAPKSARPATAAPSSTKPSSATQKKTKAPTTASKAASASTKKTQPVAKVEPASAAAPVYQVPVVSPAPAVPATNGHTEYGGLADPGMAAAADSGSSRGGIVAVGTVESAITEHGEADFCDETPEELSADQMRELGLYDDGGGCGTTNHNLAQLPMEGSYYGKDDFEPEDDDNDYPGPAGDGLATWPEPMGMPAPAAKKPASGGCKCSTPIFVDSLLVPADTDKEDMRAIWCYLRPATVMLQLGHPRDLAPALELLLEERANQGAAGAMTTVIPSLDDEASIMWIEHNADRLRQANIVVAAGISRCSILIGGSGDKSDNEDDVNDQSGSVSCHGFKWQM